MKLKKLKIKTIVILIIVSVVAIISAIAFPFVNIKNSVFPKNLGQSQKTYQENNEIIIVNYNLINPWVVVIPKNIPNEFFKKEGGGYIISLKRSNIIDFTIDKEYSFATKNYDFESLKKIFKDDSILKNNTDSTNLEIPCIPEFCKEKPRLSDEEYRKNQDNTYLNSTYYGVKNKFEKKRTVDEFKKLKIGMVMRTVGYDIVGGADFGAIDRLNYTKGPEFIYDIDGTPGVNMIIVSVDYLTANTEELDKEKIKAVYIVYNDKRVEEMKLDEKK